MQRCGTSQVPQSLSAEGSAITLPKMGDSPEGIDMLRLLNCTVRERRRSGAFLPWFPLSSRLV